MALFLLAVDTWELCLSFLEDHRLIFGITSASRLHHQWRLHDRRQFMGAYLTFMDYMADLHLERLEAAEVQAYLDSLDPLSGSDD